MTRQILSITWKDLKILFKDTGSTTTLFVMPMAFIFIMTLALGGAFGAGSDNPIEILVVNDGAGAVGAQIVEGLRASEGFAVETEWEGAALTRATAEELIASQERNLAVIIPAGFSDAIERAAFEGPAGAAQIDLILDPALSSQFAGPVLGTLTGLSQRASLAVVAPRGIDRFIEQIGEGIGAQLPAEIQASLREQALQSIVGGGGAGSLVEIVQTQPAGMQIEQFPNAVQQNVPGYALFGVFFISQSLF